MAYRYLRQIIHCKTFWLDLPSTKYRCFRNKNNRCWYHNDLFRLVSIVIEFGFSQFYVLWRLIESNLLSIKISKLLVLLLNPHAPLAIHVTIIHNFLSFLPPRCFKDGLCVNYSNNKWCVFHNNKTLGNQMTTDWISH